ncbi:MAG: hypothetical protein ACK55I_13160, partial [bacterium]
NDTSWQGISIAINGSTANLSGKAISASGSGGSVTTYNTTRQIATIGGTNITTNTFTNVGLYFPNYRSSNFKSFSVDSVSENNASTAYTQMFGGLWSNTAAITSISFTTDGTAIPDFIQYSSATLYGVT